MKKYFVLLFLLCLTFSGCKEKPVTPNSNINPIAVNDIVISKSHAYVDEGDRIILLAQVFPFNSDNQKIHWKSDNENIAVVDDGIVTGKKEGRTVITATSEDGNFSDKCIVYVSYPKLNYEEYSNNLNFEKQNYQVTQENNDVFKNIHNYLNTFQESVESIKNLLEKVKIEYQNLYKPKSYEFNEINNEIENNNEGNGYEYSYQYIYNRNGVDKEDDENIVYQDDKTIIKEKRVRY